MKILKPSVSIETINGRQMLQRIERAGRTCYKSEGKTTLTSYEPFIRGIIKRGHLSVLEHEKISARVICDRGVTHEIVRHRLGSYSQESTRYVKYDDLEVIEPCFWPEKKAKETHEYQFITWRDAMLQAEENYKALINNGAKPEEARSVLPNSTKTEIVITYNLREWRHFFSLRGKKDAHPQIREIAIMLLKKMRESIPIIFDDFKIKKEENTIVSKKESL